MSVIHFSIDVQNRNQGDFIPEHWRKLTSGISYLIDELDKRGIPTVFVAYKRDFTPFEEGVGPYKDTPPETRKLLDGHEEARCAIPLNRDSLIAYKRDYSVFDDLNVISYLKKRGITKIIFSGLFERGEEEGGNHCISLSADVAAGMGLQSIIAAEATNRGIAGRKSFLPLKNREKNHYRTKVLPVEKILAELDEQLPRFCRQEHSSRRVANPSGLGL